MTKEKKEVQKPGFIFGPTNYRLLIIGLVVIIFGFILMAGGGSEDPNVYDPGIFSVRRITIAPMIVLIGFILEGIAIMYKPKKKNK